MSKAFPNQKVIGHEIIIKNLVMGAAIAAIWICLGPVHNACGMTSPKINKRVTDITTAANLLNTRSKKTGRASIANEFIKSKVHNNQ